MFLLKEMQNDFTEEKQNAFTEEINNIEIKHNNIIKRYKND